MLYMVHYNTYMDPDVTRTRRAGHRIHVQSSIFRPILPLFPRIHNVCVYIYIYMYNMYGVRTKRDTLATASHGETRVKCAPK